MSGRGGNPASGTAAPPSGRGRARGGRASARGARGARGGSQGPPLAAQLRQLDRLQEPEEMAILRRLKDLNPVLIRSTYGPGGLLQREIQLPRRGAAAEWVTLLVAEERLASLRERQARERAIARLGARIPTKVGTSWENLSQQEKDILLLSQREWELFRDPQGTEEAEEASSEEED